MNNNLINNIRTVLNILFMAGALCAIVLYFIPGIDQTIITYICFAALFLKMTELVLRTTTRFNSRRK